MSVRLWRPPTRSRRCADDADSVFDILQMSARRRQRERAARRRKSVLGFGADASVHPHHCHSVRNEQQGWRAWALETNRTALKVWCESIRARRKPAPVDIHRAPSSWIVLRPPTRAPYSTRLAPDPYDHEPGRAPPTRAMEMTSPSLNLHLSLSSTVSSHRPIALVTLLLAIIPRQFFLMSRFGALLRLPRSLHSRPGHKTRRAMCTRAYRANPTSHRVLSSAHTSTFIPLEDLPMLPASVTGSKGYGENGEGDECSR
ncbi:hypothetical protein R3P38DRAFT_2792320 [Favolaschia claudopus]|uniref:Uncharacterized protein n=1 Tax=Favolaschia claudopus TaxID=2862362 RepID=A0AAW0AEU6_9AGAR